MSEIIPPTTRLQIHEACGEPMSGHTKPFSNELRTCEEARMYRLCPDPLFCRRPERCSTTKACHSQQEYGRACND